MTTPEQDMEESRRLLQRANHYLYGDGADPVTGAGFAQMATAQATLALAGFMRDGRAPEKPVTNVCVCGHQRNQHIYDSGPCRPGFACDEACTLFVEAY